MPKNTDIEAKEKDSQTRLLFAARNGDVATVRLLLEKGADIEAKDEEGRTPLSWAIQSLKKASVQLLLDKGADIEAKDKDGLTPLAWAARRGHKNIIPLLLEKGADIDAKDKDGLTPLAWAAKQGYKNVIELLLEKGADIEAKDEEGRTPLMWAAQRWREAIVLFLIKKGANIEAKDEQGRTPLSWAVKNWYKPIVQLLLDNGANMTTRDGQTALLLAVKEGHEILIQLLLEKGADIEAKDEEGRTPLMWAVQRWSEAIVLFLIKKGADIEAKDKDGLTPLAWAVQSWREDNAQLLIEKGADIEAKDEEGRTPLMWAVQSWREDNAWLLLEKGANIEAKDEQGRTPLSWALRSQSEAGVRLLLEKGADIQKIIYFPRTLPALIDNILDILLFPIFEPPIPPGQTRIRWKCRCGQALFDDFVEVKPGSLQALETRLQELSGTDNPNQHERSSLQQHFQAIHEWYQLRLWKQIRNRGNNVLPTHHRPNTQPRQEPANDQGIANASQEILHLFMCIDKGVFSTRLYQEQLQGVGEDRELFEFLREQYFKHRNFASWFTLRGVKTLSLTRFQVDTNCFASVHSHERVCKQECVCIPPVERVDFGEYQCRPAPNDPPGYFPVIGSNELRHYFFKQHAFNRPQRIIFNQLPKRARGPLPVSPDESQLGWGIHIEEGWHWRTIYVIVILLTIPPILFGIMWA